MPLRLTMSLWQPDLKSISIHLAVEGSCGGSSLGIQLSRQVISNGGRVLNFVSLSSSFKNSRERALKLINQLNWGNGFFRSDIANKVINE